MKAQEFSNQRAVVLLSGGLDSATCLAIALAKNYQCTTLAVDYGQRHRAELDASRNIAKALGVRDHREIKMDLRTIGGSALTDDIDVPDMDAEQDEIPVTYVPARNTVMLSLALGLAEVVGARNLFIGVNAVDYSGYPDCRPEFIAAFQQLANLATKAGVEGVGFRVHTPLIDMTKAEIVTKGTKLGVDYGMTVSCYQANATGEACGHCDSCHYRREGFAEAKISDPTRYA